MAETHTIILWRCPECGEAESTGPLVNCPGYADGEMGHCAECLDEYPAPDPVEVIPTSSLTALADEWEKRADACGELRDKALQPVQRLPQGPFVDCRQHAPGLRRQLARIR